MCVREAITTIMLLLSSLILIYRNTIDHDKYTKAYSEGYQARIDYEHGK